MSGKSGISDEFIVFIAVCGTGKRYGERYEKTMRIPTVLKDCERGPAGSDIGNRHAGNSVSGTCES